MKKYLSLLMVLCMVFTLAACQSEPANADLGSQADQMTEGSDSTAADDTSMSEENLRYLVNGIKHYTSGNSIIMEYTHYAYDEHFNLTSITTMEGDYFASEIAALADDPAYLDILLESSKNSSVYTCTYDESSNKIGESYRTTKMLRDRYDAYDYSYDASGNLLEENHYNLEGNSRQHYRYTYSDAGDLVLKEGFNQDGEIYQIISYTYDENHHMVSYTFELNGELNTTIDYIYDDAGNLLETRKYNHQYRQGALECIHMYTCDADGNTLIDTTYNYTDAGKQYLYDTWEYTYDENGNVLTKIRTDGEGSLLSRYRNTYDEDGRLLIQIIDHEPEDDSDGLVAAFVYDENGNLLSETYTNYDSPATYNRVLTYDADGRTITEALFYLDGSPYRSFEYIYNEQGNLDTEICYSENGSEYYRNVYSYIAIPIEE